MSGQRIRILRRLIRVGNSYAITLPAGLVEKLDAEYVWIEPENDTIRIRRAVVQ